MSNRKNKNSTDFAKAYGDYLLMLFASLIVAFRFYGSRALLTGLVSVGTALLCEITGSLLTKEKKNENVLKALCTGLIIALMLPANVPLYIPFAAGVFAALTVKIPFGSESNSPFVPSAVGFAFVAVCFKEDVFTFGQGKAYMSATSVGSMLLSGKAMKLNGVNIIDILCGNFVGPMGTGCILLLFACFIFLLIRRKECLVSSLSFILSASLFAAIFPRTNADILTNIFLELFSSSLMFAAVFLLTDYSTLPEKKIHKIVYGVFCGIITMLMRKTGAYEEPVCFAVIIANAFCPLLKILADRVLVSASARVRGAER